MAILRIQIPDNIMTRVINALSYYFNYQTTITDGLGNVIPNPETKRQFIVRSIQEWLINITRDADVQLNMKQYDDSQKSLREGQLQSSVTNSSTITLTVIEG